jgi:hypothetical protein
MTPDEFRTLVLARCGDVITGDDFDMLSAAPGEEMIPASILSEVLEVLEMIEARMLRLEGGAQDDELDEVA